MNKPNIYYLKLTSSSSKINLPFQILDAQKIKVLSARFTPTIANSLNAMIKVVGFNENIYFDGQTMHKCVKIIPLPDDANTLMIYENQNNNIADVELQNKPTNTITTLNIEV